MDKNELKQTLIAQFVPYDKAIQNKLNYLQSDNAFADLENTEVGADLSLEDAFGSDSSTLSHFQRNFDSIGSDENNYDDEQLKMPVSIAEKIAALRGISAMPGDYIRRNK